MTDRPLAMPDFLFGVTPGDVIYDIETYPNCFTLTAKHKLTGKIWRFEISLRRNDAHLIRRFLDVLKGQGCRMVGFNNLGFDYPVIHYLYNFKFATVADLYDKAVALIKSSPQAKFAHLIWPSDWIVPQIDLFKIHHFDNKAKSTSLKVLEFNMRMDRIEDLPFEPGTLLTSEQIDTLLDYNLDDVDATERFYERSEPAIRLRESLSEKFDINMMNMSDVKIGETLLVTEMEKHGIQCYYRDENNRRRKRQTLWDSLALRDVILPYVKLETPEFNRIHQWLMEQTITETNGVFKDLKATVGGIEYKLGTGGIHASVECRVIESTASHQLVDVDVASFYPNLGIKNKFYPAHLGSEFCDAYDSMYATRGTFPKKTPENEAYKLGLNGAFGGSNNEHSPFYDMSYTMKITLNGQLLLCMLIEQLLKIPGLSMIQANTDGVTFLCPREHLEQSRAICRWWENLTQLTLEEALYSRMFIRDVNSYIAEFEDGSLKRIGAYAYVTTDEKPGTRELPHHKDWSQRIVAKAAEAALVRGEDIRTFIQNHDDVMDFMLRTKVPRSSRLMWGEDQVANTIRYYISVDGDFLEKVMPAKGPVGEYCRANKVPDELYRSVMDEIGPGVWDPRIHTKNRSQHAERRSAVHTGYTVRVCNDMRKAGDWGDINYDYYVNEAEKLVLPLLLG